MERVDPELVKAFAAVLTDAGRKAWITQEMLSERSSVSTRYVSYLETGKRQPTLTVLKALTVALDIPMSEIMGRYLLMLFAELKYTF